MSSDATVSPERDAAPQWRSAGGDLLIEYCDACDRAFYYPRGFCPFCLQPGVRWLACRGTGVIYSFSVMRRGDPYVIAYVTLEEGPTLLTNIIDSALAQIAIGAPVQVVFQDVGGVPVPMFKLAASHQAVKAPS